MLTDTDDYVLTKREQKAELLTIQQACEVTSLGKTKLRELASDAGAVRKIGRNYRVRKDILLNYIEENCKAE